MAPKNSTQKATPAAEQQGTANADTTQRGRHSSTGSKSEESEWTFPDLSTFLSVTGGEDNKKEIDVTLKDANAAELKRGHIIYIQEDFDSRLQNRIMLVIRQKKTKAYFTCLALCRHWRAYGELDQHWQVVSLANADDIGKERAEVARLKTIEAIMRPECPNNDELKCALYKGTTIDIWSLWHVSHNVKVMVLGSVTDASLEALGRKVAEVTLASLPGCKNLELCERRQEEAEIAEERPVSNGKDALPLRDKDKNLKPKADKKVPRK